MVKTTRDISQGKGIGRSNNLVAAVTGKAGGGGGGVDKGKKSEKERDIYAE